MRRWLSTSSISCLIVLAGCEPPLSQIPGVVQAGDLAGSYTGVLEGVTVSTLDHLEDPERHVIVDLDLLHRVTIGAVGAVTLRIGSTIIPPLRATVLGYGPVAINVEFVEFEDLAVSGGTIEFDALTVKQIVFVRYQGEWIVVLQLVRVPVEPAPPDDDLYVYQYVSYPSSVAGQMSESQAIVYVNTILQLASAAQRL